jgi:sulfur-carrier protein
MTITLKYFGLLVDITQKKEELFLLDEAQASVSFLKSKLETVYEELKIHLIPLQ